jgi:hypothetical protein
MVDFRNVNTFNDFYYLYYHSYCHFTILDWTFFARDSKENCDPYNSQWWHLTTSQKYEMCQDLNQKSTERVKKLDKKNGKGQFPY